VRVAILGAECTGKSTLALALANRLQTQQTPWAVATEYLREWCDTHQRTPLQAEQHAIAQTQVQRVNTLAAGATSVVADTTSLMTAIYSHLLFQDESLYAGALEHMRSFDLTLVTATDLAWVADGLQRDGATMRFAIDRQLRYVLLTHQIDHALIYGEGDQRLQNALEIIAHRQKSVLPRSTPNVSWHWSCDTCSDPDCEHRLFTRLTSRL
jgi:HTH-type transcriptional regulator, transcriptional repressor of NAD biosynthesis genes